MNTRFENIMMVLGFLLAGVGLVGLVGIFVAVAFWIHVILGIIVCLAGALIIGMILVDNFA